MQTPGEDKKLSHKDIEILMKDPSPDAKVRIVEKLAAQYNSKSFSEAQISLAEQIFRLLLRQAEIEVRKALSENLMNSNLVPRDVILSLARDVEEVATPVLEFSNVLTESDLLEIIRTTEKVACDIAISKRSNVPESVSAALIDTGNEKVVGSLMKNDGAVISEKSFDKVVAKFSDSAEIVEAMVTRGSLPPSIIESLTQKVSHALQQQLEEKYKNKFKEINAFFKESTEIASLKFAGKQKIDKDLITLVNQLEKNGELESYLDPAHGKLTQLLDGLEEIGRVTPTSCLCMGHLVLFEISISRLTGIPFTNINKLLTDVQGFKSLYDKAKLPPKLIDAIQFILVVIRAMDTAARTHGTPRAFEDLFLFARNIASQSRGKDILNLAHLVSIIHRNAEETLGEW